MKDQERLDPTAALELAARGDRAVCGNCRHANKGRTVGRVICTALPPQVIVPAPGMAQNVYPELDADKLGCTALWNVGYEVFMALLGRAAQESGILPPPNSGTNDKGTGSDGKGSNESAGSAGASKPSRR